MASGDLVLAMTLVVRDEEDVLPVNLDYHLAQGVGIVLVTDHGSRDGTPEILEEYARSGRVRWWRQTGAEFPQDRWVNGMLRAARDEHHADWVLHGDADEFWVPLAGTLRDVFAVVPERYGYLKVPRHDFPALLDGPEPFYRHMVFRRRTSRSLFSYPRLPKIAQRPAAGTGVAHGNHELVCPAMDPAPDMGTVEIHHFQIRSYEHFVRRVAKTEETADGEPGLSQESRTMLHMYRAGRLRDCCDRLALGSEEIAEGLETGELVLEPRLQSLIASRPREPADSPQRRELLAALWRDED
jgi:hypothetical protein